MNADIGMAATNSESFIDNFSLDVSTDFDKSNRGLDLKTVPRDMSSNVINVLFLDTEFWAVSSNDKYVEASETPVKLNSNNAQAEPIQPDGIRVESSGGWTSTHS